MKRRTVTHITALLLLISTIICIITGIIKWPGLIPALGLTYQQVPLALMTTIHDWSGMVMMGLIIAHLYQFRAMMKHMVRGLIQ